MISSRTVDLKCTKEDKLPKRDWILLPVISLFTIVLLAVSVELIARLLFPISQLGLDSCFVKADSMGGAPVRPNSVCSERIAESKFVAEYRFNKYGHRAGMEREPKQTGTYRIVMIGSSLAFGLFSPREMTFAGLLPTELSRQTGRKIELYNEARGGKFRGGEFSAQDAALKFHEVLAAAPDMILWIVTPVDIENPVDENSDPAPRSGVQVVDRESNSQDGVWTKLRVAISNGSLGDKLRYHWEQTRTSIALKHFLYGSESPDQYVKSYLKNESEADFLKAEPSANFQRLKRSFEVNAADFERQAKAAGVPVVAVLVPNRAQAAMISMGEWPIGFDPYQVDKDLRAIIVNHGGTYIDILPAYRKVPAPEQHYFPVDGHPDADGQAMIAEMLAKTLTSGAVAALHASGQFQSAVEPAQ